MVEVFQVSSVQLLVTPETVAHQVPLSMGFPRQEYWSGLPFPLPGDLPNPGIEPMSPELQVDSFTSATWEALLAILLIVSQGLPPQALT